MNLKLAAYGPFNTATVQETYAHHPDKLMSLRVVLATSTPTDDWSGTPQVSMVQLRSHLAAGLYVVALTTERSGSTFGINTFTVSVVDTQLSC